MPYQNDYSKRSQRKNFPILRNVPHTFRGGRRTTKCYPSFEFLFLSLSWNHHAISLLHHSARSGLPLLPDRNAKKEDILKERKPRLIKRKQEPLAGYINQHQLLGFPYEKSHAFDPAPSYDGLLVRMRLTGIEVTGDQSDTTNGDWIDKNCDEAGNDNDND